MYELEEMASGEGDFKLIKKCFEDTMETAMVETQKIYRVSERAERKATRKGEVNESGNLLLFHGTSPEGRVGIINEGFKSPGGRGVYLTASSQCAVNYSKTRSLFEMMKNEFHIFNKADKRDKLFGVFVNEVLESEKLQVLSGGIVSQRSHFVRNVKMNFRCDETYERDGSGRRIRSDKATESIDGNHYVCDEKFVIPRFFIQFVF